MSLIVIDARELRSSTGRYIERLLYNLQKIDTSNDYKVLLKPSDMDGWETSSTRFTKVACKYKEFSFGEQIGLLNQIKKLNPDLVHFGMVQQPILYKGSVVTTMHDLTTTRFKNPSKTAVIFTFKQFVYRWVNRVAALKSNYVITPSEFVKDDVAKFAKINSRKIVVTYEGADHIDEAPEPLEGLEKNNYVVYVGRPQPHKNLYRLVSAFATLKKSNPRLKLVLVGKKDVLYEQLESWVNEQEIRNIIFTGFVSEGELRWLYENCNAYVFPSLSEGFGLPGLEAMCHGAAVISSNATCLPEIYGDAAHYFDPLSVDDISSKINEVVSNNALRKRLIERGYKQVKKYSWRRMAEQTLEVYKSTLDK